MISPRSKKEYKYIINAHGGIITRNEGNVTKYMAIKIPTNVEIFTYANLGEILWSSCRKNYFICDNLDKVKSHNFTIETPIHKYKYISETQNKFPEIALSADTKTTLAFYSGIVHCIPKHRRTTKAMEVIYNIDALVKQNCDKTTIGRSRGVFKPKNEVNTKVYDTDKQYSTYYKTQLENKDTEDSVSNKCGPLLLSQAIKVIQAHCKTTYPKDWDTSTIQIYLSCCFGTIEIKQHNLLRDQFFKTSKEEYKKELAQLDITNELLPRDDEQMENYYKIQEGYYSLDMNSIINHNLYTTHLRDFDSSKTSEEETEDGNSYSYIYRGKQIILIVSKLEIPKYETQTFQYFGNIIHKAIYSLDTHLLSLDVDFDELPNKITIDLRHKTPSQDKIYDKLLQVAIESKLNSRIGYDIKLGANIYDIQVRLEHDTDSILKNKNYSDTKSVISKLVNRVSNHEINKQSIFTILDTYIIKLKVSDLNKDNDKLYEIMIAQVEATAQAAQAAKEAAALEAADTAAAHQRDLMNLVRKEAEAAEKAEAAREAAARERAQAREIEARETKERAQIRKKEAQETAQVIETLRKVRAAAAEREAEREAAEREAEREAIAREAAREAIAREAIAREAIAREANNKTGRRSFLSTGRTRVAPEDSEDLNTNKSQNRSRTMGQRLGSLFSRKSRKVAPQPVMAGIKTKFRRKHRRKHTRKIIRKTLKRHRRRHRKI